MGCNCKRKPYNLNNTKSKSHLLIAQEVYNRIIVNKTIEEYDDFDRLEIFNAYKAVYPNASSTPSIEEQVLRITGALEYLKVKYK